MADKKQKMYRKKATARPATFGFLVGAREHNGGWGAEVAPPPLMQTKPVKPPVELHREADRLLLTRYAPPAVVVNENMEILQSRGRTGNYLELAPGKASLHLLKMARPGLLFELQEALEEAGRTGLEAVRRNLHVEGDGTNHTTTVRVVPFRTPAQDQQTFLVVFEPVSAGLEMLARDEAEPLTETERAEKDKQIALLKQEMAATKEYLQSIIEMQEATNEELQSANEEIQSGNEELQSTNEALQASKEELESATEELRTVNEEVQHRNDLLTQLNNDLTNLLNSINLPIVMVSSDLSVRRFTPQATAVLGLMAGDVGRPVSRLKLKIDARALEQMMLDVIQEVQPVQKQVQGDDGRWFTVRITPYRTLDNRIGGAVLTVVNRNFANDQEDRGEAKGANGAAAKKDGGARARRKP